MSVIASAAREVASDLEMIGTNEADFLSRAFDNLADTIERNTPVREVVRQPEVGPGCGDKARLRRMLNDMRWAIKAHPGTNLTSMDANCVEWHIEGMSR
ncbi:hypothetical protein ONA92_18360 [Mycobacteroides salmoniphilum]|uniref:hypothetical protein n=1 Tax=Mycobacteroides salmoniphilum TaxID=404941 RepID=UPI003566E1AC